jgi:hypothetical protein
VERRGGDDVGVEEDPFGAVPLLDAVGEVSQRQVEAHLQVVGRGIVVAHPVWLHEDDLLGTVRALYPEDEVRVKAARGEETRAFAPGEVAQEEELRAGRRTTVRVRAVVPERRDETPLAFLQA